MVDDACGGQNKTATAGIASELANTPGPIATTVRPMPSKSPDTWACGEICSKNLLGAMLRKDYDGSLMNCWSFIIFQVKTCLVGVRALGRALGNSFLSIGDFIWNKTPQTKPPIHLSARSTCYFVFPYSRCKMISGEIIISVHFKLSTQFYPLLKPPAAWDYDFMWNVQEIVFCLPVIVYRRSLSVKSSAEVCRLMSAAHERGIARWITTGE